MRLLYIYVNAYIYICIYVLLSLGPRVLEGFRVGYLEPQEPIGLPFPGKQSDPSADASLYPDVMAEAHPHL